MGEDRAITRRQVLGGAALAAVGAGVGRTLPDLADTGASNHAGARGDTPTTAPFHGQHQAGVGTRAQDYLYFASFDVTATVREEVEQLLGAWTKAAAIIASGQLYAPRLDVTANEPPMDTGDAQGLSPSNLTLTFGFGPALFGHAGRDPFGLARERPAELATLPKFRGESLQAQRSGGD